MNLESSRKRVMELFEEKVKLTEENEQLKEVIKELERQREVLKFQLEKYRQRELES